MSESPLHQQLVLELVEWMQQQGVDVTHASGGLALPDPIAVGRHEPDAIGSFGGVTWYGEAKVGPDLDDQTSQEQFHDFTRRYMKNSEEPCKLVLCVPRAFEAAAGLAVEKAGGNPENLLVIVSDGVVV